MEQEKLLELIQQSKQGDPEAQDALVRAAQPKIYYHCKKMLKNEEDAQDATQDVLIAMITSLDKLREPAAFWGWVNSITANRCKHLLSAPHKEWQIPEDEEGSSMLDSLEDLDEQRIPDKALDNEETRRMILGLVDDLPPEQRMSVLFYYYDEMSVKQIAEAMDTSEGTVKSRLNYARKSIKSGVEDYERKGVKLYSVSPLLLLAYFLRMDAEATTLSAASAAAMAKAVTAAAGGAVSGTAAGSTTGAAAAASGAGSAASAATTAAAGAGSAAAVTGAAAAGTAVKVAGVISTKLIAGIAAGAIAIGGAAVGITSLTKDEPEPSPVPTAIMEIIQALEKGKAEERESAPDSNTLPPESASAPADSPYATTVSYDPDTNIRHVDLDTGALPLEIYFERPVFAETTAGYAQINAYFKDLEDEFFADGAWDYSLEWAAGFDEGESCTTCYTAKVLEHTQELVCIRHGYTYYYTRAMHSMGSSTYYCFRTDTGERVYLTDLLNATEQGVREQIEAALLAQYPNEANGELKNVREKLDKIPIEEINFYISDGVCHIHFDQYVLASYAFGPINLELPIAMTESEPETETPPGSEAKPEAAVLPAAYTAYLDTLNEHQSLIDAYSNWHSYTGGLKCVAFVDIMGDSTPEMIFVEAASALSSESYLNILAYQNGQTVTLVRESWDFLAGSGLSYDLYQAEGGKELYAYSVYGDTYTAREWIRFEDAGGQLSMQRLASNSSDGGTYTWNGAAISEAEYTRIHDAIPTKAEHLVMSSKDPNTLSMSCDDARAFLQGNT